MEDVWSDCSMITPALNLVFTTASLDSRITFTRTTGASNPATYVGSNGYITSAANNAPRFDYDPVTLVCKGLLIEESRANSFKYSNEFTQSGTWAPAAGVTVSNNQAVGLDGLTSADQLIETATTGTHRLSHNTGLAISGIFTMSCWFKIATGAPYASLWLTDSGGTNQALAWFNVASGSGVSTSTLGSGSVTSATMENWGNGWYRCILTGTPGAGTSMFGYVAMTATSGVNSYAGDGSRSFYLWGAQLEAGAFVTSYNPTTTTALTRNADVATITGTNFSGFWQASKGGVLVRARPGTVSGTRPGVQFDDNTADNIIALRGNTTNPELYVKATTDQAQIDAGTIAANTSYRLAGTWATNDCAASLNGAATVLDTSATIPAVTQMRIGSDGTNYLNGHIEAIEYYDQRLLDASMQVVSSPAGYRSIIGPVMRDTIIR
jgi:hypothetical protein